MKVKNKIWANNIKQNQYTCKLIFFNEKLAKARLIYLFYKERKILHLTW